MRGDGRVFRLGNRSRFYWCAYFLNGTEYRESTKTTTEEDALRYLKRRMKQVGSAQLGHSAFVGPKGDRMTVNTLLDNLVTNKKTRGRKDPSSELKPVRARFGSVTASKMTSSSIAKWVEELLEGGKARSTCNRYTQLLGQAFNLALKRRQASPTLTAMTSREIAARGRSLEQSWSG